MSLEYIWWERFSGWAVAALLAAISSLHALWTKGIRGNVEDLQEGQSDLRVVAADHETRLQLGNMANETMKSDISHIKTSMEKFDSKLDRLLARRDKG